VAGAAKIFKPGDVVFKAGDKPDGMYIVRKGELQVFLDENGKQVVLANVPEGGIVGEMALFDKQNRSASVKASKPSEVTQITVSDFEGLMKQIPKWFVTLMGALSERLRSTNERLQKAETGGGKPMQGALRLIAVIDLIWARHGEKDEKGKFVVNKKTLETILVETLLENPTRVQAFLKILSDAETIVNGTDTHKQPAWAMPNRAFVTQFPQFVAEFLKGNPPAACMNEQTLKIMQTAAALAPKNPYDPASVPISAIFEELKIEGDKIPEWRRGIEMFKFTGKSCAITQTSEGETLKVVKADIGRLYKFHQMLSAFINQSF
jgi:CRP-like cAMP-binding protein